MNSDKKIRQQVVALCKFAGVSPRTFTSLMHYYGSLDRIVNSDAGTLMAIENMSTDLANKISHSNEYMEAAEEYLETMSDRKIGLITRFDKEYPGQLLELNDPPPMFYLRGKFFDKDKKIVAISGTEKATNKGIELTINIVEKFVKENVQLVTSLRKGIDAAAQLGYSTNNGFSCAVLDNGFDNIIPEDNVPLAIDITKNGCILSEYAPDSKFSVENYKESNRLIASIAQAVIITEIYNNSEKVLDLLKCCNEIGKLCFIIVDPVTGAHADKESLNKAVTLGAIPMVGLEKIDDIIVSLV
ncbi:MAG: DNA-processing protein DprA [candidate division Zixibacteria bacterium]|nr:DNA-processing protein DprA [candidate division Zixibacteria bacterium]